MKGPRGGGEGGLGVRGPRGWKLRGIGALEAVVFRAPWMAGARRRCRRRTGGEDRVVLRLPLAGPRVGPGG